MLNQYINQCTADMRTIAMSGIWTLDAQVRAYDLLDALCDWPGSVPAEAAESFCKEHDALVFSLVPAYDQAVLEDMAQQSLAPFKEAVSEAEEKVARLTDLHEYAKYTFDVWQTKGLFARQKAIRILRQKAGFRLETKRIGNYVAKTFDLMNEARSEYARAQQALFAADLSYKIRPGIYTEIRAKLYR
jgi:hypothetical protein